MNEYIVPDSINHNASRFVNRTNYIRILLLGLPCSGKTSLFNLLSNNEALNENDSFLFSTTEINMRICKPIDERLEYLYHNFKCSSQFTLKVNVIDTPALINGSNRV